MKVNNIMVSNEIKKVISYALERANANNLESLPFLLTVVASIIDVCKQNGIPNVMDIIDAANEYANNKSSDSKNTIN